MKRSAEDGLTLLEVLLGLTISALIFAIILSALRLAHRSEEKGLERQELSQRMRILTDRLSFLIRGAYPFAVETREGKALRFAGASGSVGLVTTGVDSYSGEPEDRGGLKWVSIYVDGEGLKIREKMFWDSEVLEDTGGKEYLLDPTVRSMSFEYLDTGEQGELSAWTTVWETEDKPYLPAAVRIELTLEYKGREVRMPPIVSSIMAGKQHM